jgi:hypothetical protein
MHMKRHLINSILQSELRNFSPSGGANPSHITTDGRSFSQSVSVSESVSQSVGQSVPVSESVSRSVSPSQSAGRSVSLPCSLAPCGTHDHVKIRSPTVTPLIIMERPI